MSVIGLLLLYGLCQWSGLMVERLFLINSLVQRTIIVFTVAAAQLVCSIQLLSIPRCLTWSGLLAANALLSVLLFAALRPRRPAEGRSGWGELFSQAREMLRQQCSGLLLVAGVIAAITIGLCWLMGYLVAPIGDEYHFDMPIFWSQHHTILPFLTPNPRLVTISFVSEALSLPGYLFCRTARMTAFIALMAAVLCVWLVMSVARRLGCSSSAAVFSALMLAGYSLVPVSLIEMKAEMFLAMMWSGASLLFLFEMLDRDKEREPGLHHLCWSIFCFLMACGAKNSVTVSAPLYLAGILLVYRRVPLRARSASAIIVCGAIGLICSGVLWNYTSNKVYFGNLAGPPFMQELTSTEFHPRAVWTRVARGGVLFAVDTTWLPHSAEKAYATLCATTLNVLGSQERLVEDTAYYGLTKEQMKPQKGYGFLGISLFLPGIILGGLRAFRHMWHKDESGSFCLKTGLLVFLTVGTFVLLHTALRWQSIGVVRLAPFLLMAGAPLTAVLFDYAAMRVVGLVLLALCSLMFITFSFCIATKRHNLKAGQHLSSVVGKLRGNKRQVRIEYRIPGVDPENISIEKELAPREIYRSFMTLVAEPATIGYVGVPNSEPYPLFGNGFRNRLIPLNDSSDLFRIAEPKEDMKYLVYTNFGNQHLASLQSAAEEWSREHRYKPVLQASIDGVCMFEAFARQ